jgi:hypothetical protein
VTTCSSTARTSVVRGAAELEDHVVAVDRESHDSGERLGVEQDDDRGHSGSHRQVVASEEASE